MSGREDIQFTGWEGNSLLSILLLNPVGQHTPRPLTEDVRSTKVGRVMTVSIDETLPRVFRRLASENFLGCPVMDGNTYCGMISMLDLVKATNCLFWSDVEAEWVEFFDKKEEFASTTVRDIINIPSSLLRDPHPPISADFTTFFALEKLVREELHRIALVDPENPIKLTGIITHSMLISHLRQIKPAWGDMKDMLIACIMDELNPEVTSVKESDTAMNAFNMMEDYGVSGLPVVDDDGILVNHISIRDLRGVGTNGRKFFRLFRSVKDFKQLVSQEYPSLAPRTHWSSASVPDSPIFVTPSDTIEAALDKMEDGNIHRIFVCEEASVAAKKPKVLRVLSQRDILKVALDYAIQSSTGEVESIRPASGMGYMQGAPVTTPTGKKASEEQKGQEEGNTPMEGVVKPSALGKINIPIR
jgi:CBS domain-containing protein